MNYKIFVLKKVMFRNLLKYFKNKMFFLVDFRIKILQITYIILLIKKYIFSNFFKHIIPIKKKKKKKKN